MINKTKAVRGILGTSLHVLCKEHIKKNIFQDLTMSIKYINLYSGSTSEERISLNIHNFSFLPKEIMKLCTEVA